MSTIKLLHQTIWSSPLMLLLFIASVGYLIYRIRQKKESGVMLFVVIYSIAGLILITYNPILPRFFNRFADDNYSWLRFAWIIPIYLMMAYAGMRAVTELGSKKKQAIAVAVIAALIIVSGEPRPDVYLRAQNALKLDPEIIEVCDIILADRGITDPMDRSDLFRVLVQTDKNNIYEDGSRDNQLYFGIRQYTTCMELSMGQAEPQTVADGTLSYENSGLKNGYAYLIADNDPVIIKAAEEIGYEQLGATEKYVAMKSHAKMNIWFIRHAQTEANAVGLVSGFESDYPLTDEGIEAAVELGKNLKDLEVNRVYHSFLQRTSKTAALVTDGMGIGQESAEEALEYGNSVPYNSNYYPIYNLSDVTAGEADSHTLEETMATYNITDARQIFGPVEDENYVSPVTYTENNASLYDRQNNAICDIVTMEEGAGRDNGNVIAVGHSVMATWIERIMPEHRGIALDNTSVTLLRFEDGEWSVLVGPTTDPEEIRDAVERYGDM